MLSCAIVSDAQSDSINTMNIYRHDGSVVSFRVADVDSITFSASSDGVEDLGAGANTYIVPKAGKYSFSALHVSGKPIENIDHVDWIWCTKSADSGVQDYISDISYDNGKVTFTASDRKGDVVLAAYDSNDKIVWTWLLWMTDTPGTMKYQNGATFMDRNIGATSANPSDQAATWGLLWQWGRITPFFGGYDNEWNASDAFTQAKQWTIINPNYPSTWSFSSTATTLETAIANPLTFYGDSNSCDWITPEDSTLWGRTKTDYDPSPAGYRLPMPEQWTELSSLTYDEANVGYTYTYDGKTAWWPASGSGREFDTGCNIIGNACTYVWSASASNEFDILTRQYFYTCWRLLAERGGIYTRAMGNPAFAHSVRCIVDE